MSTPNRFERQRVSKLLSAGFGRRATKAEIDNYFKTASRTPNNKIQSDDLSVAPELSIAAMQGYKEPITKFKEPKPKSKSSAFKPMATTSAQKTNSSIKREQKVGSIPKTNYKREEPKVTRKVNKSTNKKNTWKRPVFDPKKGASNIIEGEGYIPDSVKAGKRSVDAKKSPDYRAPIKPKSKPKAKPADLSGLSPELRKIYDNMPNKAAKSAFLGGMNRQANRVDSMNTPSLTNYADSPDVTLPSLAELNARGSDQSPDAIARSAFIADSQDPYVDRDPRMKRGTVEYLNKYSPADEYAAKMRAEGNDLPVGSDPYAGMTPENAAAARAFDNTTIRNRENAIEFAQPFEFDANGNKVAGAPGESVIDRSYMMPKDVIRNPNGYVAGGNAGPSGVGARPVGGGGVSVGSRPTATASAFSKPVVAPAAPQQRYATVDPLNIFGNSNGVNPFGFRDEAVTNDRFSGGVVPTKKPAMTNDQVLDLF